MLSPQEGVTAMRRLIDSFGPNQSDKFHNYVSGSAGENVNRNGAGEIFITAAAEIARATVSAVNRFGRETGTPPQIREKQAF
jgi:hypothetical protein